MANGRWRWISLNDVNVMVKGIRAKLGSSTGLLGQVYPLSGVLLRVIPQVPRLASEFEHSSDG